MCQFIETIRVENGVVFNLEYHQRRLQQTILHHWPSNVVWQLNEYIPQLSNTGLFKLRMVYDNMGVKDVTIQPYYRRSIQKLALVQSNSISYSFKSVDRDDIQQLYAQRGNADDVLIVKNGLLTDTSFSNVAFFDGSKWYTPATPLLNGTMRQYLIDAHQLNSVILRPEDCYKFEKISLINAMLPLGDCSFDVSAQTLLKDFLA